MNAKHIQRLPAEIYYADELKRLRDQDPWPKPPGWSLSPRAVEAFVLGDSSQQTTAKFVAPSEIVTRVIISLATQRGAMLVGEPGTAKSWLSELICAAICDDSTLIIQGGAIETVQQLLYTWNTAILERQGPCLEALIPGPMYRGMERGLLVRYEEIARSSPALQDALLSIMSERSINIPELAGEQGTLYARDGFNLVATSNTTDVGVNEMSSALKRRMNFETIRPIKSVDDEIGVVMREAEKALLASGWMCDRMRILFARSWLSFMNYAMASHWMAAAPTGWPPRLCPRPKPCPWPMQWAFTRITTGTGKCRRRTLPISWSGLPLKTTARTLNA